jgi:5'-nucleotidase
MHLLLTNDDGIEAQGLQSLAEYLRSQPTVSRVTIVAPVDGRSCCGHTVNTYAPIQIQNVAPEQYAIDGWPADCVRIAIVHLGLKPDWILSGVNHGGNLGLDITMSGTCGAAREGTWLGYRAIALSQYRSPRVQVSWSTSAARAWSVASQVIAEQFGSVGQLESPFAPQKWRSFAERTATMGQLSTERSLAGESDRKTNDQTNTFKPTGFWNVNLPSIEDSAILPSPVECDPDPSPHRFTWEETSEGLLYRSSYQDRPRLPGHDIECCFQGSPTVSFCKV